MSELHDYLSALNASIEHRQTGAEYFHNHPENVPKLFDWATAPNAKRVNKTSAWILEVYVLKDISVFHTYWPLLLERLPHIKNESMRRPLSKITHIYLEEFFDRISAEQKSAVLGICFDWLLEPAAVATLNFALRCLYLLKDHEAWVWEQLQAIVQEQYPLASPGYKVAARQIMNH
ncbi:MAG: hypothetical protein ACON42_07190 [Flavobacteriaceae bacterium]